MRTGPTVPCSNSWSTSPSTSLQALIAARLDTVSPERKAVLQDASVVGRVFWAGAVAFLGDVDEARVLGHLHELTRKEFVRPAAASSFAGQTEFGFWHALIRDAAYGQIPRAARSAKHRRAAAWIDRVAGERTAESAGVLAH